MSTATLERESAPAQRERRELLHGMAWVVWRQHRGAVWTGLVLLVVLAGVAVYLRNGAASFVQQHDLAGCTLFGGPERCGERREEIGQLRSQFRTPIRMFLVVVMALPFVGGLFVGAPLIAKELETGTYRLAWGQSITPQRWLLHKLALPIGAMILVSAIAGFLASWVLAGAGQATLGLYWYSALGFVPTGPALVGYAALGIALGGAVGLLVRRTVASMALTLAGLGAVLLLLQTVRSHLATPVTYLANKMPRISEESWVLSDVRTASADGKIFPSDLCAKTPDARFDSCLADHGATYHHAVYHPLSHMRQLQFTEGAICLALAALLVAASWWWLRRRAL